MGGKKDYFQGILVRFFIFVIILLAVYPAITSFKVFKSNLLIAAATGIFLLIANPRLEKASLKFNWKKSLVFFIISLVLIILSFSHYNNFNNYLSEGVYISENRNQSFENKVFLEKNSWLNLKLIEDTHETEQMFIDGKDYTNKAFKKEIYLKQVPKNPKIKWFGSWHGSLFNDNVFNPDIHLFMSVNGKEYNITKQYQILHEYKNSWMELNVSEENLIEGKNELIIFAKNLGGIGEDIGMSTQSLFVEKQSFVQNKDVFELLESQEFIWYIKNENSFGYKLLFKLSFIFRVLSIIFLLFAIFGSNHIKFAFKFSKKELFFSFIWIYLIGLFSTFAKEITYFLSQITTFVIYFMLKITGFSVNISLNASQSSIFLGDYQVSVGLNSSGAVYMIYFLIAFTILILLKWREFKFKKIMVFYFIGLVGIFLLNILNLYILTIIGNFLPRIIGFTSKYLPDVLIIIFFIIFWPIFLKYSTKNGKK
ncbi:MAG: exosortase/archaeosortase family protein [Nanoarchaeota archaeon]|nr:exosortase/archaeosortase family protein [Nanoarchaeota archaeon]